MLQKGRPFQRDEEESYQENRIRAKPRNQRKTLPSMMFLLITFTNNPKRPTSSQVQATGWSQSTSQGRPCGGAGKCPRSGPHRFTARVQITLALLGNRDFMVRCGQRS